MLGNLPRGPLDITLDVSEIRKVYCLAPCVHGVLHRQTRNRDPEHVVLVLMMMMMQTGFI